MNNNVININHGKYCHSVLVTGRPIKPSSEFHIEFIVNCFVRTTTALGPGLAQTKDLCRFRFTPNRSLQSSLSQPNITLISMVWHILLSIGLPASLVSLV